MRWTVFTYYWQHYKKFNTSKIKLNPKPLSNNVTKIYFTFQVNAGCTVGFLRDVCKNNIYFVRNKKYRYLYSLPNEEFETFQVNNFSNRFSKKI